VTAVTETRTWQLTIPAPAKMFSANTGAHWRRTGEARKAWREASFLYATQAKLPKGLGRVRIDVSLHFTVNRGRDDSNYHPYVGKPIVDGLSKSRTVKGKNGTRVEPGYELIPDDTSEFLESGGPSIVIGDKVSKVQYPLGLAVVTITDVGGLS
jgi:hypothetical protein